MTSTTIEVKCPVCGHTWYQNVAELGKNDIEIYKGVRPATRTEEYRVACPNHCGARVVITVKFEAA